MLRAQSRPAALASAARVLVADYRTTRVAVQAKRFVLRAQSRPAAPASAARVLVATGRHVSPWRPGGAARTGTPCPSEQYNTVGWEGRRLAAWQLGSTAQMVATVATLNDSRMD